MCGTSVRNGPDGLEPPGGIEPYAGREDAVWLKCSFCRRGHTQYVREFPAPSEYCGIPHEGKCDRRSGREAARMG